MPRYRHALPQLGRKLFLSDGGLETTLIFQQGIDLPCFASIDLVRDDRGLEVLYDYFRPYLQIVKRKQTGFILESPTWRAHLDWAEPLGYTPAQLEAYNLRSIELMERIRGDHETPATPMVISACIGPRGDGYVPGSLMSIDEARDYHAWQIGLFARTQADMVSAFTINYVEEAIGIALAARDAGIPCVISFTVETDGNLPTGDSLLDAIAMVDDATGSYPVYYMINCAHTSHFKSPVMSGDPRLDRIRGLRANASRLSHAELEQLTELDTGNPAELGADYRTLAPLLRNLTVMGGCCGTDHRHIEAIADHCCAVNA